MRYSQYSQCSQFDLTCVIRKKRKQGRTFLALLRTYLQVEPIHSFPVGFLCQIPPNKNRTFFSALTTFSK
jgi:hypothetical protein